MWERDRPGPSITSASSPRRSQALDSSSRTVRTEVLLPCRCLTQYILLSHAGWPPSTAAKISPSSANGEEGVVGACPSRTPGADQGDDRSRSGRLRSCWASELLGVGEARSQPAVQRASRTRWRSFKSSKNVSIFPATTSQALSRKSFTRPRKRKIQSRSPTPNGSDYGIPDPWMIRARYRSKLVRRQWSNGLPKT